MLSSCQMSYRFSNSHGYFPLDQVVGYPKPLVKWYRSGKEVEADGTKIKAQEFKGGYYQLVITAAEETDATVYQVRATNSSGSISTTANLEVEGKDIILGSQKQNILHLSEV